MPTSHAAPPGWDPLEGETPIDDISGLKIAHIATRGELSIHEAENIRKATVTYLAARPSKRRAPFCVSWMLYLHREMLGDVWEWAGKLRKTQKNIGVPANQLTEELKKLEDDIGYWSQQTTMGADEISARIHHRAVHIHPFENGNGRWARMLANVWLRREQHPVIRWPERSIGTMTPEREGYLAAIRAADVGDYQALIDLHRRWSTRHR